MKRNAISTLLLSATCLLSFLCGCNREPVPNKEEPSRPASLRIVLDTKGIEADQGDEINTLAVFIVDQSDNILGYANSEKTLTTSSVVISPGKTTAEVLFTRLLSGNYTIYYIANIPTALTLEDSYSTTTTFTSTGLRDYRLPTISGTDVPDFSSSDFNGMPITLVQNATLNYGMNNLSAKLLRSAARFSVDIYPHMMGFKVCITDLSFSAFNPSDSYLFVHETSSSHEVPTANIYRNLPRQFMDYLNIDSGASVRAFDAFLYEGHAGEYKMNISGAVFDESQNDVASLDVQTIYSCTLGSRQTSITSTSDEYLIEAYDKIGQYLYMDGATVSIGYLPSDYASNPDGCRNYRWTFSGYSSGSVRNVGTGTYFNNLTTSLRGSNTASVFYFGSYSNFFYIRSGYILNNRYYFVSSTNPSTLTRGSWNQTYPSTSSSADNQKWYLRQYTISSSEVVTFRDAGGTAITPVKTFNLTGQQLNYINSYGSASNLEHLCRNEYLRNRVNIYYNSTGGYFHFEVLPWQKNTSDITFD